jgi:TIR domain
MSSLAKYYSSNLVGFFSYSREDDVDFDEELSKFRNTIQAELRAQLGRSRDSFRIWQDKFAIPHGGLWQKQITDGIKQSAFFIPIITPRMVNSPHCTFEFDLFLAREKELGRDDLVFPILYISVPEMEDGTWKQSSVLKIVNDRQYLDWREYRPRELSDPEIRKELIQFCRNISNALRKPWVSPEEGQQRQEAEAVRIAAEEERRRKAQIEAERAAEEESQREADAASAAKEERKKITEAHALETTRRIEDERQRREAEASRVAKEKQRSKVAETPALAVAAKQKTDQEPSLTVFVHAMSEVSGWWQSLPGVLKIVLTIAVAGVLALVFTLDRIGLFTGRKGPTPQIADRGAPQSPAPQIVPVQRPSFDCETDRKPVEQAICGDAELSSKDRVLHDLYIQILGGLSGQARTDLIQAESDWLNKRNQCHDPGMAACITQSYDSRIRELHATARH